MFLFIFIFLFSSHRHGQAPVSGDSLRFTRPSVRGTVCVECSTFSPRTCLGRHIGLPLHFCCLLGQPSCLYLFHSSIIHSSMLAHFAFSHPRGINFVYASRDQWLQNSPITKFCFIIVQLSILRYCVSLWRRLHLF